MILRAALWFSVWIAGTAAALLLSQVIVWVAFAWNAYRPQRSAWERDGVIRPMNLG